MAVNYLAGNYVGLRMREARGDLRWLRFSIFGSTRTCQQSGSSYPPSLLKRKSAGVDCMLRWRPHPQVSDLRTCLGRRSDHPINWSGTKILQRASHTMELVMKEALCIQSTPADSHFNRDGGYVRWPRRTLPPRPGGRALAAAASIEGRRG